MSNAKVQAGVLREEAKMILRRAFKVRADESNGAIERFVDCVIDAAVLEIAAVQAEAVASAAGKD